MSESRSSARRVAAAQRRVEALELRKGGLTFSQIGGRLGCSEQRAHFIVTEELRRLNRGRAEAAAEVARLELERLDAMHAAVWERAAGGDLDAVSAVVKLMARRAKILGIDAPTNLSIHKAPPVVTVVEEVLGNGDGHAADPTDRGAGQVPPEPGAL